MKLRQTMLASCFCFWTSMVLANSPQEIDREFFCSKLNASVNYSFPKSSQQIILVNIKAESTAVIISSCQKKRGKWQLASPGRFRGQIGKKGIAKVGSKHEGDLKTPAGSFALGPAFGTYSLNLKIPYRQISTEDKFIDDPISPEYNTWVRGKTLAKSFETMLQPYYTYGVVVNYNMHPVISGAGSAIFLHVWDSPDSATSGCITMAQDNISKILHWLNSKDNPYIIIFEK